MPAKRRILNPGLKDDLQQIWIVNSYSKTYSDQFGFVVRYGRIFRLEYKGKEIAILYSIAAAKMISTIILNDLVMNKEQE